MLNIRRMIIKANATKNTKNVHCIKKERRMRVINLVRRRIQIRSIIIRTRMRQGIGREQTRSIIMQIENETHEKRGNNNTKTN